MTHFNFEGAQVSDVWKQSPTFPGYEISWNGEVRDRYSKKIVQPTSKSGTYIRLSNKHGVLITNRVDKLRNQAFYREIAVMGHPHPMVRGIDW